MSGYVSERERVTGLEERGAGLLLATALSVPVHCTQTHRHCTPRLGALLRAPHCHSILSGWWSLRKTAERKKRVPPPPNRRFCHTDNQTCKQWTVTTDLPNSFDRCIEPPPPTPVSALTGTSTVSVSVSPSEAMAPSHVHSGQRVTFSAGKPEDDLLRHHRKCKHTSSTGNLNACQCK